MAPALFLWAEEAEGDVDLGMSSLPTPTCPDAWGLGLPSLQVNTPVSEALAILALSRVERGWALEKGEVGGMHQPSGSSASLKITLLIICHNYTGLTDT